jgi:hypothetical protein
MLILAGGFRPGPAARPSFTFSMLEMAGFVPEEPFEPKRRAVLAAIDALEAA